MHASAALLMPAASSTRTRTWLIRTLITDSAVALSMCGSRFAAPHMLAMPRKSSESRAVLWLFARHPDHLRTGRGQCVRGSSDPADQRLHEPHRVRANRNENVQQFENVEPAFPALVFGHE